MEPVKDQPLPEGSWKGSASNYKVQGNVLYAQLRRMNGSWNQTSVQFQPGDNFMNNNGNFEKELSKDVFEQVKRDFPKGSWINSARNYEIRDGILYAELRRRDGSYNKTSLRPVYSRSYSNNNGNFE